MAIQILIITTRIFPDIGGVAKQAYILSKYFSENGMKVLNLTCISKNKPYRKKENVHENYQIIYLPFSAPGANAHKLKLIIFFFKFFFYGIVKVIRIKKKYDIDLIHAMSPPPTGLIAYFISKLFKIPYFYTIHGLDYPIPFLLYLDIKKVINNSKKTILVDRKVEQFLKANYKIKNIYWLPNMIDNSNYYHVESLEDKAKIIKKLGLDKYLKKEDFIIIYIGYMIFLQKVCGMIDFLYAFSHFLKDSDFQNFKKLKLLYVGDGHYSYILKKKINELNLKDNVIFLGERSDIKDLLSISDLLALTSYVEGFPNVLLEAMASKVPCLASDAGENKTIIDNTGFIVKPGDLIAIKKYLLYYYNLSENNKEKFMVNSSNHIEKNYSVQVIGKKLIEIYKNS